MADSNRLSKFVLEELQANRIGKEFAISLIKKINEREDIAIIGMGCKVADAESYDEYWDLIVNKKTTIKRCTSKRVDLVRDIFPKSFTNDERKYSKGTYFDDIDMFDANFFSMGEEEATMLGPGHRLMLQTVYKTLEDGGYLGQNNEDNKTGIFVGTNFAKDMLYSYSGIELRHYGFDFTFEHMLGNWSSGLSTKLASILDLKGGAYSVDASCPSAAVAIYNACMALKSKQCSMAVAGGLMLDIVPIKRMGGSGSMFTHEDNVISRNYDSDPGGAYAGEACGALLLKPLDKALEDGDRIHGIICGASFNNNGANGSFTQGSSEDVKKVIITAIKNAQVSAEDIDFLEGEGIINKIEEGLEVSGFIDAFQTFGDKRQFCGLGSISPNLGYLQASIGVLQMIKILMAMKHETIPPQCHFSEPTEMVNFIKSPFYINTDPKKWEKRGDKPRYAASYAYGYGGNNLFTVVKEPPEIPHSTVEGSKELFVLSAATDKSFDKYIRAYIDFLSDDSQEVGLAEICYTASVCRILRPECRLAVVADSKESLLKILKEYVTEGIASDNLFIGIMPNHSMEINRKKTRISSKDKELYELAQGFCSGNDYNFKELYEGRKIIKCQLPAYPFDKASYWTKKRNRNILKILMNNKQKG